ncbi:hypothetical protein [Bifidobacterium moukalabense]|uniref:hypothetical protein n=1 Tax=Bifidobacterium moukalabense TaxID=1333651 RepID=UPI0014854E90|nr:hypothetical protein [Bifidobacterium moukalabense]
MAKDYLNLDNSPFDFVNIDDSNRKMIFCPILTLAAAKDEMKAIRDCQRRHNAILRVTILRPWCIASQK